MIDALNRQKLMNSLYRSIGEWHPNDWRIPMLEAAKTGLAALVLVCSLWVAFT